MIYDIFKEKHLGGEMLIFRVFFIFISTFCVMHAKIEVSTCPKFLSAAHVQVLKDQRMITLTDVTFYLDGGSEQKVNEHDLSLDAPFAYTRTESHKIACWYRSQNGYICLREK